MPPFRARARKRKQPGEMNKLEQAYAAELERLKSEGLIREYRYERLTFKLAPDTRYTPDFQVIMADDTIRFDEVKGFMEEDAWIKLKVAADQFPEYAWRLVTRAAKKDGGHWQYRDLA